MKFPINPKGGDPILTPEFEVITLNEINDIFLSNSVSQQIMLCKRLGISISDTSISLNFYEKGRAYQSPDEDRTVISSEESIHEIKLKFAMEKCEDKFPLPFSMNFGVCSDQVFVNFYGEIVFYSDDRVRVSVPLIGRGTAALEGRENDAHAEPCIDGNCASFQQKIAILVSILAYFRITRDDIEIFRAHLLKVCEKYYGRDDILNYTFNKAFSLTTISYFEYLKNIYKDEDEENIPIMLQHFNDFAEPHPLYFEYLKDMLTPDELNKELKDISNAPKGPDKNPISLRVREIINKFIFLDEIYMIKPYPGKNFKNGSEDEISIYLIEREINSNSLGIIRMALEKFGVTINNNNIHVKFVENARKYSKVGDKIQFDEEKTEEIAEFNFTIPMLNLESLLKLKIYLDINPINNVNFFGKIEIKNGFIFKTIVPLLGRGTLALDGRLNDKHFGFCTSSESATFQQRVALVYCCLVVLGVSQQDLKSFEYAIKKINRTYHGLNDILEYTFRVARQEETKTFFEFMKQTYVDFSKMPIALKTILTYNRLPPKYFEGLISKFTEKELIEEEERIQSIRISNIIPKFVRNITGFFVKINIF